MNQLESALLSCVLPVVAVLAVAHAYAASGDSENQLCNHQYALCTSALCVPEPGDASKAICSCVVEESPSMSTVSCDSIAPKTDANGIRTVYSTFSLDQFKTGLKSMTCPGGTPWTWCLNKPCTVDPSNSRKAVCVCDVVRTGEWMTLGGNCDADTCKTGYWSGALLADFESGNAFMTSALGLSESPAKWCPAAP